MKTLWTDGAKRISFPTLCGKIKTDVLIVGGGMAGILCAYMLKNAGIDCVLTEAKRICGGVTKNTTAKITLQHGLIYDSLIRRFGKEKARLYLEAQSKSMKEYERLCQGIDCDYEKKNAYVYSIDDRAIIEKEVFAYETLGYKAELCESVNLPISITGAVKVGNQAQFHPLKFAFGIAKGLTVYENTKALDFLPGRVKTEQGEIVYKKMIIATHFPIINKHGGYFIKLYQQRSYVLALEGARDIDGMYIDGSGKGLSFRDYDGILLLGGGGHRTGKQGGNWRVLQDFARANYPAAKEIYRWATQDCMTLDGVSYIGQYSKSTPELYVATGFNKWGMTDSMIAAMLLRDLVLERKNEYADVFSPSRSIMRPQLAINAFEALTGLLTPTVPRCPHMHCALKYNRDEHSWDCSCHGSRFEENGELIDNPATDDLKS